FVPLCIFAGSALFCAGLAVSSSSPHGAGSANPGVLALLVAGLLTATLLPALTVLWVIGPKWTERQQHLALVRWERERRLWLARERQAYLTGLPEDDRARFERACAAASS